MKRLILAAAIVATLTACGGEVVDQKIIDQNQIISRDNATANARRFASTQWPNAELIAVMQSDSTISKSCRYGDGWTSGELRVKATGQTWAHLKCQTNGTGKGVEGCLVSVEYKTKVYKDEDGRCNTGITELEKMK